MNYILSTSPYSTFGGVHVGVGIGVGWVWPRSLGSVTVTVPSSLVRLRSLYATNQRPIHYQHGIRLGGAQHQQQQHHQAKSQSRSSDRAWKDSITTVGDSIISTQSTQSQSTHSTQSNSNEEKKSKKKPTEQAKGQTPVDQAMKILDKPSALSSSSSSTTSTSSSSSSSSSISSSPSFPPHRHRHHQNARLKRRAKSRAAAKAATASSKSKKEEKTMQKQQSQAQSPSQSPSQSSSQSISALSAITSEAPVADADKSSPSSSHFVTLPVTSSDVGQRFDHWLHKHFPHVSLPYSRLVNLCHSRTIKLKIESKPGTKRRLRANESLEEGWSIILPKSLIKKKQLKSQPLLAATSTSSHPHGTICPLNRIELNNLLNSVVYEDSDLIVLNKPCGLAVFPGPKEKRLWVEGMLPWLQAETEAKEAKEKLEKEHNEKEKEKGKEKDSSKEKRKDKSKDNPPSPSHKSSKLPTSSTRSHMLAPLPLPKASSYRMLTHLEKAVSGCVLIAKNERTVAILADLLKDHPNDATKARSVIDSNIDPSQQPSTTSLVSTAGRHPSSMPYSRAIWDYPVHDETSTTPIKPFFQMRYLGIVHFIPEKVEGNIEMVIPTLPLLSSPSSTSSTSSSSASASTFTQSSYQLISSVTPEIVSPEHTPFAYIRMIPHAVGGSGGGQLLRRHLTSIGCPVIGDKKLFELALYKSKEETAQAQYELTVSERMVLYYLAPLTPLPLFLHANSMILHHAQLNGGKPIIIRTRPPTPFLHLLQILFTPASV